MKPKFKRKYVLGEGYVDWVGDTLISLTDEFGNDKKLNLGDLKQQLEELKYGQDGDPKFKLILRRVK